MKKYIYILTQFIFCLPKLLTSSEPISTSINQFGSHFYQEAIASSDGNELFSPYCLFNCLSMAYIGSQGFTEKQMRDVLCLTLEQNEVPESLRQLTKNLLPQNPESSRDFKFNAANSLWVDHNTFLLSSYKEVIQSDFEAQLESVIFNDAVKSAATINEWVKTQTKGTIPTLLSPRDISKNTELMLVSALYFKGSWMKPFSSSKTKKNFFHKTPDESKEAWMMEQTGTFPYYENDDMQLVLLPFVGENQVDGNVACFFLLPKGSLQEFESSLQTLPLQELFSQTETTKVQVTIPRFEIHPKYDLMPVLSRLGMSSAFSSEANFSRMNGRFNLHINRVVHEAFFSLNEKGVTASAATAIGVASNCAILIPTVKPISFKANHPFLFGIVDLKSNVMLFLGKIVDP